MDPYSCLALTTNVFLGLGTILGLFGTINHFVRLRVAKTLC